MPLTGNHLLGGRPSLQSSQFFEAVDPRTGEALPTRFAEASEAEVDEAVEAAASAHPRFELAGREVRARFLEEAARGIIELGDELIERADAETGLGTARLTGERGRTVNQLRLFAEVVRRGEYLEARIDRADADRSPVPRPDLRRMQRAIGPVGVFAASNFPLAFSVAGGDTASALAAGCPVVAKAHPHHPGTCELVARAVSDALERCELPRSIYSMLQGQGHEVGRALVTHPGIRAVGFTGSLKGGRALFDAASARPSPIPFYGELGSNNPVLVLPGAIAERGEQIAEGLAGSLCLGAGQFCTNPGVVMLVRSPETEGFLVEFASLADTHTPATMLHEGIHRAYLSGVSGLEQHGARRLTAASAKSESGSGSGSGKNLAVPAVFSCSAKDYAATRALHGEVFGPCTLAVICDSTSELLELIAGMDGQLTATVHAGESSTEPSLAKIVEALSQRVGRLLFGGFPTGVEVGHAMHHGGPYPATTDSRSTSVGSAAIARFVRPVSYQNMPQSLLPEELRDDGPPGLSRLVDGRR
jgi:NADP-dependent aldehyde dehydrogenase